MKNKKLIITLGAIAIAIVAGIAFWQFSKSSGEPAAVLEADTVVVNEQYGISFAYPGGDNGLVLVEPPSTQDNLLKAYLMFPVDDYADYESSADAREVPAGVNVFIFNLDDSTHESGERLERITRLQNWATDNSALTSFNLALNTPDIVELDGVKALHYRADGLYQQDIYLASYRGYVYMFVGQFNTETDLTYLAFQKLISSVTFD